LRSLWLHSQSPALRRSRGAGMATVRRSRARN
jgi:hypothetical protein